MATTTPQPIDPVDDPFLSQRQAARYVLRVLEGDDYEQPGGFDRAVSISCGPDESLTDLMRLARWIGLPFVTYRPVHGEPFDLSVWWFDPPVIT